MNRIELLGIPVDPYSYTEVLDQCVELIDSGKPNLLVTVNLQSLMLGRQNQAFGDLMRRAELVVPDGVSLVWFSRLAGMPVPERVTGVDLLPMLCSLAAKREYRVFFFGAAPGVADELAEKLQAEIPGLQVCGTYSPPFGFENDPHVNQEAIALIRRAQPHILFTALGQPRQELWMERHRTELGVPLMIGVGGSFDFITGREKRAPRWMQEMGLEWLDRMIKRPGEISKRVLKYGPHFLLLMLDRLTYRVQRNMVVRIKPIVLALLDVVTSVAAWFGAYFLYFRSGVFSLLNDPSPDVPLLHVPGYTNIIPTMVLMMLVGLAYNRLYQRDLDSRALPLLRRIVPGVLTGLVLLIAYTFIDKDVFTRHGLKGFSTGMFMAFAVCAITGLTVVRSMAGWLGRIASRLGIDVDRILLVGAPNDDTALQSFLRERERGWRILGYVDGETDINSNPSGLERLGGYEDLKRILHGRKVDEVLALHFDPGDRRLLDLARMCAQAGVRLSLLPRGFELLAYSAEVRRRGPLRLISIDPQRLREHS